MKTLIIISVFNEEKNIEKCLKSLLNQTHRISQITVVNDGLHVRVNHRNHGMYSSENKVIISDVGSDIKPTKLIDLKNISNVLKKIRTHINKLSL